MMKTDILQKNKKGFFPKLEIYISALLSENKDIEEDRKKVLKRMAFYIQERAEKGILTNLIFICTHNSRRSHMAQLWAQVASVYFDIPNVHCYSGGTEATAFNYRSVKALQKAGFEITVKEKKENILYNVTYSTDYKQIVAFSKIYSHKGNPHNNFAAILTCSDADEACPVVFGADARFSVQYEDPKSADNTPEEEQVYDERCKQIAREMFYLFSKVKQLT